MESDPIAVTYLPDWRRELWEPDVPSRPAWFVTCTDHPHVGKDQDGRPWGYATSGRAHGVAAKHRRAYHPPPRQFGQVPSDHPDAHKPVGWGEHSRSCDCGDCP